MARGDFKVLAVVDRESYSIRQTADSQHFVKWLEAVLLFHALRTGEEHHHLRPWTPAGTPSKVVANRFLDIPGKPVQGSPAFSSSAPLSHQLRLAALLDGTARAQFVWLKETNNPSRWTFRLHSDIKLIDGRQAEALASCHGQTRWRPRAAWLENTGLSNRPKDVDTHCLYFVPSYKSISLAPIFVSYQQTTLACTAFTPVNSLRLRNCERTWDQWIQLKQLVMQVANAPLPTTTPRQVQQQTSVVAVPPSVPPPLEPPILFSLALSGPSLCRSRKKPTSSRMCLNICKAPYRRCSSAISAG
ncbi:hypothetical protein V8E36_000853 [Tilletia maclaganii]